MLERFNNLQKEILLGLGTYTYLTYAQMKELGIHHQTTRLSEQISGLGKDKYVYKLQKTPSSIAYFHLTAKGAKIVKATWEGDEPKYPIKKETRDADRMKHLSRTIDFHIRLKDEKVEFCRRYFDKKPVMLEKVIPDMVFSLNTPKGLHYYLYELENGNDLKKCVEKVELHKRLMETGALQNLFQFKYGYRVIVQFENPAIMEKVREKCFYEKGAKNFLFTTDGKTFFNLEGAEVLLY